MRCQACGVSAPTKYVSFHQNIGALVMRFSRSIEGELCKSCIHKYFWEFTSITLLVGWLGTISLIIAPFFIINNVVRYLGCLTMPAREANPYEEEERDEYRYSPASSGDGTVKDECYVCGRRLQADERQARVCEFCRS